MNEKILNQLRFKSAQVGYLGLQEANQILTYNQVISRITTFPESIFPSIIDSDYPRLAIEIPSALLVDGIEYNLDIDYFKKAKEVLFIQKGKDHLTSYSFDFLFTSPLAKELKVTLLYEVEGKQEKKPDFISPGAHNEHPTYYFIDNTTGDVGYFPESVPFFLTDEDEERFLVFTSEEARDEFFTNVFNLSEELEEELEGANKVCDCILCREEPREEYGPSPLKELVDALRVAYKAPEGKLGKSIMQSAPLVEKDSNTPSFTADQLARIKEAIESTSYLSASARPQAIFNILTNSKL